MGLQEKSNMCRSFPLSKISVTKTPTKRKRRRVRFSPAPPSSISSPESTTTHGSIESSDPTTNGLSAEEIQSRWYNKEDEKSFKKDAVRELTYYTLMRRKESNTNKDIPLSFPRGLERHTRERRYNKKKTVRMILMAYKLGYHPEDIARLSKQWSSWNTELSKTQAEIDRVEVLIDGCKAGI